LGAPFLSNGIVGRDAHHAGELLSAIALKEDMVRLLHDHSRQRDGVLNVLDAGDGSESKCRAISNGCVHLNFSVERQCGAGATVEQRIVLQDLDSSLHSVQRRSTARKNVTSCNDSLPDSGNDSLFLFVGYCSDTAMNDD
jgi:hypothetical protein